MAGIRIAEVLQNLARTGMNKSRRRRASQPRRARP